MLLAPTPPRTLVISPPRLTEAVLSQTLIATLSRQDPDGRVDVLAPAALAPVYRAMSAVATVHEDRLGPDRLALVARTMLARRIGSAGYRRAFVLQDGAIAAALPWLAGIRERIGIGAGSRFGLVNRPQPPFQRHRTPGDRFAALAFAPDEPLPPGLRPPQLDRPPALEAATARRLGLDPDSAPILLAPGSEFGPASEWPARHYAALAARIAARWPDAAIGLIGRPRDRALATRITALSGQPLHNWAGAVDTTELLGLIARAAVVVSTESAAMHLAAALARPHVAIYGGGDPRAERVADRRRQVLWLRLECSPCNDAHCRFGHLDCLNLQSPEAVFSAVQKTLRYSAAA